MLLARSETLTFGDMSAKETGAERSLDVFLPFFAAVVVGSFCVSWWGASMLAWLGSDLYPLLVAFFGDRAL